MKSETVYLLIAIVFICIIGFSLITVVPVKPYRKNSFFTKEYPYEGFHSMNYASIDGKPLDSHASYAINNSTGECRKVYGFDGLFCQPDAIDDNIDIYSQSQGNQTCIGSSSGLTNSKGGLCLDANQKAMLTTRGGNASGRDYEIGN